MPSSSSESSELSESLLSTARPPTTISEAAAIRDPEDLSDGLRRRVNDATNTLSMDRCLITNTDDGVRYCHVLSRTTSESVISRLEYSWGMKYGQLNVDSSSNILRLNAAMRKDFLRSFWILIPEDLEILQIYKQHTKRGLVDNDFMKLLPAGPYKYKFIASWYMKPVSVIRHADPLRTDDISRTYDFPYHDFPTIVSHVHPRFVIAHAGYCLGKRWPDLIYPHPDIQMTLLDVLRIYESWTERIPKHDRRLIQQLSAVVSHDDTRRAEEDRSDCTRAERYNWRRGRREGKTEPHITSLDRGTLFAFNALVSRRSPKDPVLHWLSQVPTSPHDFDIDPISGIPLN